MSPTWIHWQLPYFSYFDDAFTALPITLNHLLVKLELITLFYYQDIMIQMTLMNLEVHVLFFFLRSSYVTRTIAFYGRSLQSFPRSSTSCPHSKVSAFSLFLSTSKRPRNNYLVSTWLLYLMALMTASYSMDGNPLGLLMLLALKMAHFTPAFGHIWTTATRLLLPAGVP